jgi:RNA polymerase sigma factor (TIGR02999 family)
LRAGAGCDLMDDESLLNDQAVSNVTQWLSDWSAGDEGARGRLFTWVYPLARAIAARQLARTASHDLATTQLAHDTLMRLLERPALYAHRQHFLKVVAIAARQVWIDHVRAVRSDKRGGGVQFVAGSDVEQVAAEAVDRYDDLVQALDALEEQDPRKRRVIDLHYLLGVERGDIARLLDVSLPTVDRDLAFSRAWLKSRLSDLPE